MEINMKLQNQLNQEKNDMQMKSEELNILIRSHLNTVYIDLIWYNSPNTFTQMLLPVFFIPDVLRTSSFSEQTKWSCANRRRMWVWWGEQRSTLLRPAGVWLRRTDNLASLSWSCGDLCTARLANKTHTQTQMPRWRVKDLMFHSASYFLEYTLSSLCLCDCWFCVTNTPLARTHTHTHSQNIKLIPQSWWCDSCLLSTLKIHFLSRSWTSLMTRRSICWSWAGSLWTICCPMQPTRYIEHHPVPKIHTLKTLVPLFKHELQSEWLSCSMHDALTEHIHSD